MTQPPLFSVVLPTRNREDLVLRAVDSVLAQTCRDFELVVVDDGSSDATPDRLATVADERLHYLRRSPGGNAAAARNLGLAESRGGLVAFLDDDDEYHPEFLEVMAKAFARVGPEVGFGWCGTRSMEETELGERLRSEGTWCPRPGTRAEAHRLFLAHRRIGTGAGLVVRRAALAAIGGFDEHFRRGEDTDLLVRLSRDHDFLVVDRPLLTLHLHRHGRMSRYDLEMARAYDLLVDKNLPTLATHPEIGYALRYKAGWLYHHAGDRKAGRARLREALRYEPLSLRAWAAAAFFSLLGRRAPRVHLWMSRLGRRLRGV